MKKLASLPLCLLLLSGCSVPAQETALQFFAMDTVMSVTTYGKGSGEAAAAVEQEVFRLDELLSRLTPGSDISRLNDAAGSAQPVALEEETAYVLSLSKTYADELGNAFDPTVAPIMDAWGFGSGIYRVPAQSELDALLPLVDADGLTVAGNSASLSTPGMAVDLGGIAKGYAADRAVELLAEHGVTSAMLNLGGNITVVGTRPDGNPWRVGVKDPKNLESYVCVLALTGQTLSTSGAYERFFEEGGTTYHHIIDPAVGAPSDSDLLSATVVSPTGSLDDAMSTAFFVMGSDRALDHWRTGSGFELVLIRKSGTILVTEGLESGFTFHAEEDGYTYEIIRR